MHGETGRHDGMDLRLATLSRVKYTKDNAWPDSFYPVKAGAILEVDPVRLDGILESTYDRR